MASARSKHTYTSRWDLCSSLPVRESSQIDAIDVTTNGGNWSCRKRIGSKRADVTKSSLRPGFECTFSL